MSNDSVRRIMAEVKEFNGLNKSPNTFFHATPLESDLFEWHFTVRGPPDTPFADGVYHGRILLPAEYPLKPPEIILLTHNGRFEVGKRICLSVTAHHQETWQPSWGIRTILTALVGFMPSKAEGVGALDYPADDRRRLARKSWHYECQRCGIRPIEQLVIPAAVAASFPGAKTVPSAAAMTIPTSPTSAASSPAPGQSSKHIAPHLPTDHCEPATAPLQTACEPPAPSSNSLLPSAAPKPVTPSSDPAPLSEPTSSDHAASHNPTVPPSTSPSAPPPGTASNSFTASAAPTAPTVVPSPFDESRTVAPPPLTQQPPPAPSTQAPLAARAASSVANNAPKRTASSSAQEPELLYVAYGLAFAIFGVILRRLFILALQ